MTTQPNYITTVNVTDPQTQGTVSVALFKSEEGGIFGIDASYLENTDEPAYNPFSGVQLEGEHFSQEQPEHSVLDEYLQTLTDSDSNDHELTQLRNLLQTMADALGPARTNHILNLHCDIPRSLAYIVVQQGGASGEFYVHGFDTIAEVTKYRASAAAAAYQTTAPIPVSQQLLQKHSSALFVYIQKSLTYGKQPLPSSLRSVKTQVSELLSYIQDTINVD